LRQVFLPIIFLFFIVGITGCANNTVHSTTPAGTTPSPTGPDILITPTVIQTSPVPPTPGIPAASSSCPPILAQIPAKPGSVKELPAPPETYTISNPDNPKPADYTAIPVNYPGADRTRLVKIALDDICVREFLRSGGGLIGISGQERPLRKNETVAYPPALYGYQRVNSTEIFVRFDLDPVAGNVSRIAIDIR